MFDIGFWELVLISIIALIVIGPDKLPSFAKNLGYWTGKIRRLINNTKRELSQELNFEDDVRLEQKLNDLDELMENAPDRDTGFTNKKSSVEKPDNQ